MTTVPELSIDDDDEEPSPLRALIDGVERARRLTLLTLLTLVVGTAACWSMSRDIYRLLALPLTRELAARGQDPRLAFTGLADPFILYFSVSLFGGLIIAGPVLAGQVFVALSSRLGRRRVLSAAAFICTASLLFLAGAAFCYFVLIPFAVAYLLDIGGEFETAITVRDFLSFTIRLMLALGMAAELPLLVFTAARFGLVGPRMLWKGLPYATVGAFIIGAWLTPPDVISQLLLAGPLLALYLLSILLAGIASR